MACCVKRLEHEEMTSEHGGVHPLLTRALAPTLVAD
jgi:hypothetical protein